MHSWSRLFGAMTIFWGMTLSLSIAAPESGRVTVAIGEVKVTAPGEDEKALAPGDKVVVGSTVKTGPASRAVIVMTTRSAIRVGENSEATIETLDEAAAPQKVLIDLKEGSLGALLKPNAEGAMDFRIKTPSGTAAARGTFFSVAVKDGKGYTQVKEGRVDIIPAEAQ
ncbi:MAG: FecR family protein [Verrucomicrobiota bacterium]